MNRNETHAAVDFSEIIESVASYQSPLDVDTHKAEFQGTISETCNALITAISEAGQDPQQCTFYMNPDSVDRLSREVSDVEKDIEQGVTPEVEGRPIKMDSTVPVNTMLFMSPNAVTLGGEITNPEKIALVHWRYSDTKSEQ